MDGSFGLAGSGQEFTWSLGSWTSGQNGQLSSASAYAWKGVTETDATDNFNVAEGVVVTFGWKNTDPATINATQGLELVYNLNQDINNTQNETPKFTKISGTSAVTVSTLGNLVVSPSALAGTYPVVIDLVKETTFTPLRVVDFNGLSDQQSIVSTLNDPGSVEGKRFDWCLGSKGFHGGYGIQADTAIKMPGKTSSARLSIKQGSDGDPAGGDTGTNTGAFGGAISLGAHQVAPGEQFWFGMRIYIPVGFNWGSFSNPGNPGYIKFIRMQIEGDQYYGRLEHHVANGYWKAIEGLPGGEPYNNCNQIGWTNYSEIIDPRPQSVSVKPMHSSVLFNEGAWNWIECYVNPSTTPGGARRLWVNNILAWERVGTTQKWLAENGTYATENFIPAETTYPSAGARLAHVLCFTYWNGNAPVDQEVAIQHIAYHKDATTLPASDTFGNKMMGSNAIQ
jgi:hypothetical protein